MPDELLEEELDPRGIFLFYFLPLFFPFWFVLFFFLSLSVDDPDDELDEDEDCFKSLVFIYFFEFFELFEEADEDFEEERFFLRSFSSFVSIYLLLFSNCFVALLWNEFELLEFYDESPSFCASFLLINYFYS